MTGRLRVLIVDDDQNMTRTLADILTAFGHSVQTASSAAEGLAKLATDAYHCVISDVRMPDISGVDFYQAIRQSYGDLPVLLITAYVGRDWMAQLEAQGACTVLEKPFDISQLMAWLNDVAALRLSP